MMNYADSFSVAWVAGDSQN